VYKSPFVDNGYDISDYHEIDARFGTLADVDRLISEMHKRDMKLVMDLVVNHCSDQHQWFVESRKAKDNPYRDFFWWRAPKYSPEGERLPPNNWREEFSTGSAWEWDETTHEYYLHLYCKEQPDLNWENPKLRQAVYNDIMKWWLDRGCDGFRMDVINLISKVPSLPDAPIKNPDDKFQEPYKYCANGPRVHEFLQEMNREVLSKYPNLITVGETPFTHHDFDVLVPYVLPENKELQTIVQFEQQEVDGYPQLVPKDYQLSEFKEITSRWQVEMQRRGGWNSIYLEVSEFGTDRLLFSGPDDELLEPRRRPLGVPLRQRLNARVSHCHRQTSSRDAVYLERHLIRVSGRGNRHGEPAERLADRGVHRHCFPNILRRVSLT